MTLMLLVPIVNPELLKSIELVVATLLELLDKNGEAWSPILCTWSVESLGKLQLP